MTSRTDFEVGKFYY